MYFAAFVLLARIIMAAQLTVAGLPRVQPPVVEGHPFIATFQVRGSFSPGVPGGHGYVYRDSSGRTRVDLILAEHEVRFVDDITADTLFIIDARAGTYEKDSYEPVSIGWTFSNVSAVFTEEHHNILGVDCVNVKFSPLPKAARGNPGDAWISRSLGIVMKDANPSQDWTWEVTNIEFREPDPGTFVVAPGFQELHQ